MNEMMPTRVAVVVLGCLLFMGGGTAAPVVPLPNAHAHNDYLHERPLVDALDHGFCSVEADIHLVEGELLVAHERHEVQARRTLERLYLAPLLARVRENGGKVYPAGPACMLLIDIKSEGEATYAVLRPLLARYGEMLSVFRDGKMEERAVTVVISGHGPRATMAAEPVRYCGFDGRLSDLEREVDPVFMPLISDRWLSHFKYDGRGALSAEEREKLRKHVRDVHAAGARIRFWATPERETMWRELADAGVDYINTDRLDGLRDFLLDRKRQADSASE